LCCTSLSCRRSETGITILLFFRVELQTMDFFSGPRNEFKLDKCFDFTQLSKSTKAHMKNVYACMTMTLIAATLGAYIHMYIFSAGILAFIGSIGSLVYLRATSSPGMDMKRLVGLGVFGICNGLSIGPLIQFAVRVNPAIIVSALLYTTLIFISLTLAALMSQKRSMLYLGGFLFAGLNILFWNSILGMVFGIRLMGGAELYLGLAIFCGFILFDTQMIIYRHDDLREKDFIWHSVDLFMDFMNVFVRILIILSKKEEKKGNNKRR
jgi:FtsH-binding integral membrane protein